MGQRPDRLELDLEQLLKSGQAHACASCQAQEQPPSTPMPSRAVSAHGPHFYAPHLNLYFISLVEMVYAVLTAHHLFAHPPPRLLCYTD